MSDDGGRVAARAAGLRYADVERPGWTRLKHGRGFRYLDAQGKPLGDEAVARIKALVIPPAWERVWINPDARGHLQATGRDARGRKVYRYHAKWRAHRNATKYDELAEFARALPAVRERVGADLRKRSMCRERVLAIVVRLLEDTLIRVGSDTYAKQNRTFGLTTMRHRHVELNGKAVRFHYKGKSGRVHDVVVDDPKLARAVERCFDLPGYELFQYMDEDGRRCRVDAEEVNAWLAEVTGRGFTAKSFRTWAGTVAAATHLAELAPSAEDDDGEAESEAQQKRHIAAAVKFAAATLRNRPATCRKFYIHPGVVAGYRAGDLVERMTAAAAKPEPDDAAALTPVERAVVATIEAHPASEVEPIAPVK